MILACQNIHKAFGEKVILKDASFHIEEREKAAIVGINGAGKSTLLKIIMGELAADDGQVIITKGKTIGCLAQHQEMESNGTIFPGACDSQTGCTGSGSTDPKPGVVHETCRRR